MHPWPHLRNNGDWIFLASGKTRMGNWLLWSLTYGGLWSPGRSSTNELIGRPDNHIYILYTLMLNHPLLLLLIILICSPSPTSHPFSRDYLLKARMILEFTLPFLQYFLLNYKATSTRLVAQSSVRCRSSYMHLWIIWLGWCQVSMWRQLCYQEWNWWWVPMLMKPY